MKKELRSKKIKFIPVNVPKIFFEDKINVKDCLNSGWISSEGSYVKDFEKKYEHDEEIKFKTIARRNRLLGEWVAKEIGMDEDNIIEYARQVVMADFAEPGDQDVIRKVMADLTAASSSISEETLKSKMEELLEVAKDQIMNQ